MTTHGHRCTFVDPRRDICVWSYFRASGSHLDADILRRDGPILAKRLRLIDVR
jgi:hypothetical protein